jgi:D-glycero-D-manno-heptose 1,7-bisphosphate phosphatase
VGISSLRNVRQRAVFLDRDGVINKAIVRDGKPYPPSSLTELETTPGAREDLERLKHLGFLLIVVTNQPDIGRGTQSREAIDEMHALLRRELPLDDVFVCPHGGGAERCGCRKPLPGLLLQAAAKYDIDLKRSYMVGDRWRDIEAGHAAGCATIFLDFHYSEKGPAVDPAITVSSLSDAVTYIATICNKEL